LKACKPQEVGGRARMGWGKPTLCNVAMPALSGKNGVSVVYNLMAAVVKEPAGRHRWLKRLSRCWQG